MLSSENNKRFRPAIVASMAFLGFVVMACSGGGMASRSADPEPTQPELPSLLGTWQWSLPLADGGEYHQMLTFTEDGRAILAIVDGGARWTVESGWTDQTATTVTRLWFEDATDDGVDNPTHGSMVLDYTLIGDVLTVQWAGASEPWQRVSADALLRQHGPPGVWSLLDPDSAEPKGFILVIADSGEFALREHRPDPVVPDVWELTGVAELDLPNYAIKLSELTVTTYDACYVGAVECHGEIRYGPEPWEEGDTSRLAFAPFQGGIAVSPPWHEMEDQLDEFPYGTYWMFLQRLDDTK